MQKILNHAGVCKPSSQALGGSQLRPGHQSGRRKRLRRKRPRGLAGKPWGQVCRFGADVIALESEQTGELDNLPPLKSVPKLHEGERLLVGNEQLDPPDQGELELP